MIIIIDVILRTQLISDNILHESLQTLLRVLTLHNGLDLLSVLLVGRALIHIHVLVFDLGHELGSTRVSANTVTDRRYTRKLF